ncbi:MAG: hypothetical protein KC777_22335 [Cyanobacteria bacterium HKST-UBA02]|nr:hypothetical protein [Cyanobacteria bacterium HKST-UBA02]
MPKQTRKEPRPPKGWFISGANPSEFSAEIDRSTAHSGTQCAHMYSNKTLSSASAWGTLMQQMSPDKFLEKRVRMSLWVKTKKVSGWVAPWMRVDGKRRRDMLSFDNMCTRQIKGTTEWTRCDIVLDVPEDSTNIAFGVMLGGKGHVWIDDVSFEKVAKNVPTTDCQCSRKGGMKRQPVNLNFEDDDGDDDCKDDDKDAWKQLKALPVGKEGKLKSIHSDTSTYVRFDNETDETITVYWLDFEGARKRYGEIKPFESYEQQTFETHPWLLTDKKGKGLVIFVAEAFAGFGTVQKITKKK